MAECFHPDSPATLNWFDGPGPDFVTSSQQMSEGGLRVEHRVSPPAVHLHAHKAVLEPPVAIERSFPLKGVESDLNSFTRLLYQLERRERGYRGNPRYEVRREPREDRRILSSAPTRGSRHQLGGGPLHDSRSL